MNQPTAPTPEKQQGEPQKTMILGSDSDDDDEAQADASDSDTPLSEVDALKDQLMRAMAETDNLRKRAERDLEETSKYAVSKFAAALVPVLENLQRATASISPQLRDENAQVKNLAEGVEMTMRELLNVFERFGIRRVYPQGEKFNHNLHQAMQQIEDDSVEPGTVMQVLQAGYAIHDRLLQPALVSVSKRSSGGAAHQVDTQA